MYTKTVILFNWLCFGQIQKRSSILHSVQFIRNRQRIEITNALKLWILSKRINFFSRIFNGKTKTMSKMLMITVISALLLTGINSLEFKDCGEFVGFFLNFWKLLYIFFSIRHSILPFWFWFWFKHLFMSYSLICLFRNGLIKCINRFFWSNFKQIVSWARAI